MGLPYEILSLADFPSVQEVEEDLPDLLGNAIKKAIEVSRQCGLWALADDTGLEVDSLGGAPGVLSARYSGPNATYESNCRKLLAEMENIPDGRRQAAFHTVLCLRTHDALFCVEGSVSGVITHALRGKNGFGYDPVFLLPSGRTLAELDLEEKNQLSHRAQALIKMEKLLRFLTAAG
jgi:XTP/dITP diphosphohydrolase